MNNLRLPAGQSRIQKILVTRDSHLMVSTEPVEHSTHATHVSTLTTPVIKVQIFYIAPIYEPQTCIICTNIFE